MSVNENENVFSVNEGKRCNTDPTAGAKSEYSWQMSYDITVNKKNTSLFFCLFIISAQVFQRSYDIFIQTRTCSYKPRNMLQPMPGTDKMLQNLNLISCKSQFLVFPTMCLFHVLGIHLSERTSMTRVSLSASSNFTDLRCARWF